MSTHEYDLRQQRLDQRLVANYANVSEEHSNVSTAQSLPWHRSPSVFSTNGHNVSFPTGEHNKHGCLIKIYQQRFLALKQALPVKMLRPLPHHARLQ